MSLESMTGSCKKNIMNSIFNRVFSEHILDLDKKEYDEKRKNRRTQERKNREAFRELLKEYIEQGKLIYKTKWRNFVQLIKDDPRLLNMVI